MRFRRLVACASLVFTSAFIHACTDRVAAPDAASPALRPVDPARAGHDRAPEDDDHSWRGTPHGNGALIRCDNQLAGTASATIGPKGGQIAVGRNRLIVQPGALKETVLISAVVPEDDVSLMQLAPHGLVFRKPVLLVLDAEHCGLRSSDTPDVVYVNDAGAILERIEARYYPKYKAVAAPIEHFSGYALAW